ncbi:toll/interleukin-1 receptor domain-containing protein [Thermodesulfovibrionales bacterium]|nr:toll/interleukin-1 receptor domain-containing protein [Thermodesulfovibrionales bacterium]
MSDKIKKPEIFISHIHEDAPVAILLGKYIEQAFVRALETFVSSDGTSIMLGDKWLHRIEKALGDSSIVIVLASPNSVARPWINFEAGAAWIRKARVMPVCVGGMKISALPEPLKSLQACDMTTIEGLKSLFENIARIYNLDCTIQDWDQVFVEFSSFMESPESIEINHAPVPSIYLWGQQAFDWIHSLEDAELYGIASDLLAVREACCEDLWRIEKNPHQIFTPNQTECRQYSNAIKKLQKKYDDFPFDPLDDGEGYSTNLSLRWLLTLSEKALHFLNKKLKSSHRGDAHKKK